MPKWMNGPQGLMKWTAPAAGKRMLVDDDGIVRGRVVREARGGWRVWSGEKQYGTFRYMAEAMDVVRAIAAIKNR